MLCWSWACIGINSAISIGFRKDKWFKSLWCSIPQYLLVYSYTLGCAIASIAIGEFSAAPGVLTCLPNPSPITYKPGDWTWTWVFIYLAPMASLAVVLPTVGLTLSGMRHFKDETSARIQRGVDRLRSVFWPEVAKNRGRNNTTAICGVATQVRTRSHTHTHTHNTRANHSTDANTHGAERGSVRLRSSQIPGR